MSKSEKTGIKAHLKSPESIQAEKQAQFSKLNFANSKRHRTFELTNRINHAFERNPRIEISINTRTGRYDRYSILCSRGMDSVCQRPGFLSLSKSF